MVRPLLRDYEYCSVFVLTLWHSNVHIDSVKKDKFRCLITDGWSEMESPRKRARPDRDDSRGQGNSHTITDPRGAFDAEFSQQRRGLIDAELNVSDSCPTAPS